MASQPTGTKRLSASRALEFLNTLMDNSSDESDSASDDDCYHLNYDRESDRSSENSDHQSDLDLDIDQPGPSTSTSRSRTRKRPHSELDGDVDLEDNSGDSGHSRPAKRRVGSQPASRNRSRRDPRPEVEWGEVTNGEGVHFSSFRFIPPRAPGVSAALDNNSTPLDCFTELFDDGVKNLLKNSINDFAAHKVRINTPARKYSVYASWTPITDSEIYKFLAVLTQMGLDPKPQIRDYWDKSDNGYSPWYSQMFDRNRFQAILHTMLHCSDEHSEGKDKVEPFINVMLQRFQAAFYPDQNLALDEMVIGWNGRWKYTQYNPSKPSKYHVKVFGLVDSTSGYVVNLLVYFGSETSYSADLHKDSPQAIKVFEYLLRPFSAGHHLYSDRYYTSYKLLQFLNERKMYFTGTINVQRVGFPAEIKTLKLPHMGVKWYFTEEEKILCLAFKDKKAKKPCVLVSTNTSVGTERRLTSRNRPCDKPIPIFEYNERMNGCDRTDQLAGYYNFFDRKTYKWWKKLFFWIIELAQINALVLFKKTHVDNTPHRKPYSLRSFKKTLVRQLESLAVSVLTPEEREKAEKSKPNLRPNNCLNERFTGNIHLISHSANDRNCVVCSTPTNRRRTNFFCKGCSHKPYLHPKKCFEQYHTPQ